MKPPAQMVLQQLPDQRLPATRFAPFQVNLTILKEAFSIMCHLQGFEFYVGTHNILSVASF
jgi:hypothetical protein